MSAEVVSLSKAREERSPHISGEAFCMACNHKWVGVAKAGETQLECPACQTEKGVFTYPVVPSDAHWQCNCGNRLFYATLSGFQCPNCGKVQVMP